MTQWLDADGDPLPETLALKPARLKWLVIFVIAMGFVAIAVFLGDEMEPFARWGSGGFFALCALIALPLSIGVGSKLELNLEGFACTSLFKTFRRRWADCSEFTPVRIGPNMMIGFSSRQDEENHPRGAALARGLTGTSGALPDTYGVSADELADVMNRFRARALGLLP